MSVKPKKAGRPKGNPDRKAIKPNISLRRDLIADAEAAAAKRGMGLSEYATMALTKQVARDEDRIDPTNFVSGDPDATDDCYHPPELALLPKPKATAKKQA